MGYVALSETGLSALWLRPEFRHRRFGDQLFGQAVSVLRAEGVELLQISVPASNPEALSFFAQLCGNPVRMDEVCTAFRKEIGIPARDD